MAQTAVFILTKWLVLLLPLLLLTGCGQLTYYMDMINGHAEVLNRQQPIDDVLANPDTEPHIKARLRTLQQARDFAVRELSLPDNDSYKQFSDIKRKFVVWNVIAAKALSVEPKQWCYWFVGCMSYRGFYNEHKARAYAAKLKAQGYDTYVAGVRAYSTLGWTTDPLLNTMLYQSESRLVGILFHELAHQRVYRQGDSTFNESFATVVEQEGIRRWLQKNGKRQQYEAYLQAQQQERQFRQLLLKSRQRLAAIYRQPLAPTEKLRQKQAEFNRLKHEYQQLKACWADDSYDAWMAQRLNNAHLALLATYTDLIPQFRSLLVEFNHDLPRFYRQVKQLSELSNGALAQYWQKVPLVSLLETTEKYANCQVLFARKP